MTEPMHPTEPEKPKKVLPKLRMVVYPNEFLRFKAVDFDDEQIKSRLVKDTCGAMIRSMYEHHGVGLAAEQVGVPNSVFVMDPYWHVIGKKKPRIFLNPELLEVDSQKAIEIPAPGEGCLSLPYGYRHPIPRCHRIKVGWTDLKLQRHEQWFEGMDAIVIQHEMDHLHGLIFPDRLSHLKQDMFKRRVRKVRRQYRKGYKRGMATMKERAKSEDRLQRARQRGAALQEYRLNKRRQSLFDQAYKEMEDRKNDEG